MNASVVYHTDVSVNSSIKSVIQPGGYVMTQHQEVTSVSV